MNPILVFDYDQTLVDYYYQPFPQIPELLQSLVDRGYKLYLCSHNARIEQEIEDSNLAKYFVGIAPVAPMTWTPKSEMISVMSLIHDFDKKHVYFFDDSYHHVNECRRQGLHAYEVDPMVGVTKEHVEEALAQFQLAQIAHKL